MGCGHVKCKQQSWAAQNRAIWHTCHVDGSSSKKKPKGYGVRDFCRKTQLNLGSSRRFLEAIRFARRALRPSWLVPSFLNFRILSAAGLQSPWPSSPRKKERERETKSVPSNEAFGRVLKICFTLRSRWEVSAHPWKVPGIVKNNLCQPEAHWGKPSHPVEPRT